MWRTVKSNKLRALLFALAFAVILAPNTRNWYKDSFLKLKSGIEEPFSVFSEDGMLKELYNKYMILTGRKHVNGYVILNDGRPLSDLSIGPRATLLEDRASIVIELSDYLKKQETDFLFVNLPFKLYNNSELPRGYESTMIEDVSWFLTRLKDSGVDILDVREHMSNDFSSFAPLFFWGDGHWNNEGALYTYGKIGQRMNSQYGFRVDPQTWDLAQYERLTIKNALLPPPAIQFLMGAQGGEDLDLLYPKFSSDFTIETFDLKEGGERGSLASGDYLNVFIPSAINGASQTFDYRSLNRFGPGQYRYTNQSSVEQKKILLITDSFGWILAPYLSTGVGTMDYLYLDHTDHQVYRILQNNRYDLVIFNICEGWIDDARNNGTQIVDDYMYLGNPPQ